MVFHLVSSRVASGREPPEGRCPRRRRARVGSVSSQRAPDRVKDRDQERTNLYRAGFAVMRRNGYANVSITDILNEAKISTRAFYRHFASKDDLLIAMFRDSAELTRQRLEAEIAGAGSPVDQLMTWVDEILDMGYDARKGRVARLFASDSVRATFADAGHEAIAKLAEPLLQVLKTGVATGDFPRCDPDADAGSIHAIVWRLFMDAMNDRSALDRDDARAHVVRFVMPALGVAVDDRRARGKGPG